MLKRFAGIGVAIVVALGWWGFSTFKEKASAPEVGECVTVEGTSTDPDVETAECGGDDVLYKVVADDGECDLTEVSYTVTVRGSDAVDLCLFWDVEEGDCVKEGVDKDEKVACEEAKAGEVIAQVKSVHEDAKSKCAKTEYAFVNEKRDQVVCLGQVA